MAVGYLLLLTSWAGANPPGASPDEPAHLTRALAVASGEWRGHAAAYRESPEFGPRQLAWINRVARAFDSVRAGETWSTVTICNSFHPEVSAACLHGPGPPSGSPARTYVGTYQPALYAPPGLAARLASSPEGGVRAGRAVMVAITGALLVFAVAASWSPPLGPWSLVGLMAGVTPTTLFLGSSLNPNGAEIAAGAAWIAGLLRLGRDRRAAHTTWIWSGLAASGVVLAVARSLGPLWLVLGAAAAVAIDGRAAAVAYVRAGGLRARLASAAIAVAVAGALAWEAAVQPHPTHPLGEVVDRLLPAASELPEVLRQQIGVFGWLDAAMPAGAYAAWRMLLVVLVTLGLLVAGGRSRRALVTIAVGAAAVTVGLAAAVIHQTGFGMQGRYVMPVVVAVPLVAGEVLARRRSRLGAALPVRLPAAVAALTATVHLVGWYANGRRQSVGVRGPVWFIGRGAWSPPGGWATWAAVALIGAVALVLAGRREPRTA
ncbi:MAG TPA: DUF2142 domain-containing protein [Acidimicrobiales bacterium]|nr:DUF2142 domain-containing protein [Acidimicrobiales bacterium]